MSMDPDPHNREPEADWIDVVLTVSAVAAVSAWLVPLPTIGLLWVIGWLK